MTLRVLCEVFAPSRESTEWRQKFITLVVHELSPVSQPEINVDIALKPITETFECRAQTVITATINHQRNLIIICMNWYSSVWKNGNDKSAGIVSSYATGTTHGPRKLPVFDLQRRFLSPIHSVAFVIFLFSPRIPERFRMLLQNPERGNRNA